jgi:hypothetical protein
VPADVRKEIGKYFNDAEQIEEFWKKTKMIANTYNMGHLSSDYIIEAFKATLRAHNLGQIVNGSGFDAFVGYFYGALTNFVAGLRHDACGTSDTPYVGQRLVVGDPVTVDMLHMLSRYYEGEPSVFLVRELMESEWIDGDAPTPPVPDVVII